MGDMTVPTMKGEEPLVEAPEPVILESNLVPESEHEPSDSCMDDRDVAIVPLSGQPFFQVDISSSHIGVIRYNYQLAIPKKFTKRLPSKVVPVTLIRGERTWEMAYLGDHQQHKRFDIKWKAFAKDNKLKVGDVCIFELMECSEAELKFRVQVLRGDFPPALVAKQNGSSDSPIVVD